MGLFPRFYPGWEQATYWLLGLAGSLGLFAGVLVHECSHALTARARGYPGPHRVTLCLLGGVARLGGPARTPHDECLIAAAGPLSSFAVGASCWGAGQLLALGQSAGGALLAYLAAMNLLLGLFNLLPVVPFDGGHIVHSVFWCLTGRAARAGKLSAWVGLGLEVIILFWQVWRLPGGPF